jgi:hypothetical protein
MPSTFTAGKFRLVRHRTGFPGLRWYFALDLGQRRDHSALAALSLQWVAHGRCPVTFEYLFEPQLSIRFLKRFAIGLSYENLYELLKDRLQEFDSTLPVEAKQLIVDAGGPGPPIVDRLRRNLSGSVAIRPVIITGGKGANTLSGGYIGLPRRTIVSNLQLLMAANSLKCDNALPGWSLLKEELLELSGADTQPGDKSAHDDLAIATGLAAWAAANDFPELLPEIEDPFVRPRMDASGPLF